MPAPVLHLRPNERKVFEGLSDSIQEEWKVDEETLESYERSEELEMRYRMASFDDPALQTLCEEVKRAKDARDIEKIAGTVDFSSLPHAQVAELFFILGTRVLSAMIRFTLERAESDEDLEGIAALTEIRHMLFEANTSS